MNSLKRTIITSVIWRFCEQFSTQIVSLVISIVLARLLGPEEFGTIALLTIFIEISACLVNSGFGSALIQKKNADELDFNSVFYFSIVVSILVYFILFISAPFIASFYSEPILIPVLRVTALKLIFDAISSVQNAILTRKMLFSKSFMITLPSTIISGASGIYLAYAGCGIWALAWSSLVGSFSANILRWFIIGWKPKFAFSFSRLKELFKFGSNVLISSLIDKFFTNIYGLLIGKFYTKEDLGHYNRGSHIPQIVMGTLQGSIASVLFPALSKTQDDIVLLKDLVKKSIQSASLIVFPAMFLLAATSDSLVLILFSEKWKFAVPFMQIACISYAFWHLHATNLQVILALKRSDLFLKMEILKKVLMLICIALTLPFGVIWLALGKIILTPLSFIINAYPNKKLINYNIFEQIKDFSPALTCATIAFIFSYVLKYFLENIYLLFSVQCIIFVLIFMALSYFFNIPLFKTSTKKIFTTILGKFK